MRQELSITTEIIDETTLNHSRRLSAGMGAVVQFLGVVRELEGERAISAIDYEAFVPMARHQFGKIFDEIDSRWSVESIRLVHRIGRVPVNEPSLWVEVIAPHRGEAFEACQYLIHEMKKRVPIWKRIIEL
ncbi:MAG: molybdenum cofactor biosynthesis protein MoaE [Verrucomicrobiota bacterium]|nr:molybdenum cofactor biosynthesis protein MoaE [Verrucomicrobiota bacterium]